MLCLHNHYPKLFLLQAFQPLWLPNSHGLLIVTPEWLFCFILCFPNSFSIVFDSRDNWGELISCERIASIVFRLTKLAVITKCSKYEIACRLNIFFWFQDRQESGDNLKDEKISQCERIFLFQDAFPVIIIIIT